MALRVWAPRWRHRRVCLRIKSDSVSALVILLRFKTGGEAPGIIAREIALDVAAANYIPTIMQHIPGVANTVADVLSRWYEPGSKKKLPSLLRTASLRIPPPRVGKWWRASDPTQL